MFRARRWSSHWHLQNTFINFVSPRTYHFNFPEHDKNGTCMVASFAAYFEIEGGYYIELKNGKVDLPSTSCPDQDNEAYPAFTFDCGRMNFFIKRSPTGSFCIDNTFVGINYGPASRRAFIDGWVTKEAEHSFRCASETTVPIIGSKESPALSIVFSNFTIKAFRDNTKSDFYQVQDHCAAGLKV